MNIVFFFFFKEKGKHASDPSHANFTLPSTVSQAQGLHQMLPPRATSLLLTEITEQFLALVNENSEIAFIVFILVRRLQVPRQVDDL